MKTFSSSRRSFLRTATAAGCVACGGRLGAAPTAELAIESRQITFGPRHHFFGYIGQVRTIPWNASGRSLVALRTSFQDRMPEPTDAAEIVLLDAENDYRAEVVERTLGWNPQQGTMLYWNPEQAETQFFFNDRDPRTGKAFAVLYDAAARRRVREYRFDDTPVGNGGVMQGGGFFAGLNYGRMARLRLVTGYPGAYDWTRDVPFPADDGVFKIDVRTGAKRLLASFAQLADFLRPHNPLIDATSLFINHTLWNREDDRLFCFVRGNDGTTPMRVNMPVVMDADGGNLRRIEPFIGGHPEWMPGRRLIGALDGRQVVLDTDRMAIVDALGTREQFEQPEGDVALSPDGKWFVNGARRRDRTTYHVLRLADGAFVRSAAFQVGPFVGGETRIDPGPLWSRDNRQLLVPGLADDGTRQLFVLTIRGA